MHTECSADLFGFTPVERRAVVAGFDGGQMTSDAGALLLGATDRAIGLVDRFADCFTDSRAAELIEHTIRTLVGQRIFALALGYEDLVDHDELRHDPTMAVLAGKLSARRKDCAPLAGKSTLNRLERGSIEPTRYHRIAWDGAKIEGLFVDLFVEAHQHPPKQIILDLDATDDPLHGHQEGRFYHGYYDCYCYLPLYIFCGPHLLASKLRRAGWPVAWLSSSAAASSAAISATRRWFLARPNRKSTPSASHQLIKASRANPESARSTMRTSGQRARIRVTMRAVSSTAPADPSMSARRSFDANRCGPQKMYSGK